MKARRRRVEREERHSATPETLAKLQPDPLREMERTGFIGPDELRAADELRAVYLAITRDVMAKVMRFGNEPRGRPEMPDILAAIHAQRFVPWANDNRESAPLAIRLAVEREPVPFRVHAARALRDYACRMRQGLTSAA